MEEERWSKHVGLALISPSTKHADPDLFFRNDMQLGKPENPPYEAWRTVLTHEQEITKQPNKSGKIAL